MASMDGTAVRRRGATNTSANTSITTSSSTTTTDLNAPKIQQPKPQALPSRSGPNSILVSPRQKGNPILNSVRRVPWEYSDIPADYVLGSTTCALFLSLKYHRLHPEYVYNRIRDLKGQYGLRILLTMVDIENHEESIRELSKTSLINNVTVMLCWSAQEAGRYLELFKNLEHSAPTSIRARQSSNYSDNLVEFITVPRSINKTDALGLVSNFGSLRTATNAGPEEIGLIAGWGEKKVERWCSAVRNPFRIEKASKRTLGREEGRAITSAPIYDASDSALPTTAERPVQTDGADTGKSLANRNEEEVSSRKLYQDDGEASEQTEYIVETHKATGLVQGVSRPDPATENQGKAIDGDMSEGIMAALNKLRQQ